MFRAAVTGGAIAALGLVGIGSYALGVTSTKVIHACYENRAPHTLIKDSTCPAGYTALDWNVTGPPGAPGTNGSPGPSTAGPSGLDFTKVQGSSVVATSTGLYQLTVTCPSAEPYIISGSFRTGDGEPNSVVEDNAIFNASPQGWNFELDLSAGTAADAYAICSK